MKKLERGPPVRLLLIDDHAGLVEATSEFLRKSGLVVRIAESGNRALEVAATFRPDIVLCDFRLPDMSGLQVARALRDNPETSTAMNVMYSAKSEADIRALEREVNRSEIDLLFTKPLTQEKLDKILGTFEVLRPREPDLKRRQSS